MSSEEEGPFYKQVIVIRKDLGIRKGKMIAQGCHASRGASEYARYEEDNVGDIKDEDEIEPKFTFWKMQGETKIVVGIEGREELVELYKDVNEDGIPAKLVRDRGHTELEPGTLTAVGIGPDRVEIIDQYTGELDLL